MAFDTVANTDSVWRFKPFMRLWLARVFIAAGVQILAVAIGWHMYEVTRNPYDLGMVGLLQFIPRVALVLVVGSAVDRYDRRKILGLSLMIQGAVAVVLAVGASPYGFEAGRWVIYGLSLAIGVAQAFTMPAMQSLVPNVVPPKMLQSAITAGASAMQGATIIAPALGGLLYAVGGSFTYALDATCFLVAAGMILTVPVLERKVTRTPVTMDSIFAGMRFMRSRPDILGAVSLDLFAVLLGGATALLPLFADQILHTGPWGLGLLRSAPAVGALAMSIVIMRRPVHRHVGKAMFASVAIFGLATAVFGFSTSFWVSLGALVVLGAADMVSVVIRSSFVQLETPDDMRGRVSAVNSLFIGASNELGEFESGVTAGLFGPVRAVVLGGVGTLVVVLVWMRLFPTLTNRDRLVAEVG